jgi:hypothetical protein
MNRTEPGEPNRTERASNRTEPDPPESGLGVVLVPGLYKPEPKPKPKPNRAKPTLAWDISPTTKDYELIYTTQAS